MDFPLGWPVIPAANVRRARPLAGGATALVGVGEQVRPDQPVAERPGAGGERVAVLAGLAGRVTQITPGRSLTIEGAATIIQGIFGLGGAVAAQLPLTLLQRAAAGGAVGIVAASMAVRELESFARADLLAALDGLVPDARQLPLTLLFTEGVGTSSMDSGIFQLLAQRAGDIALLTGTTDPRRNVRPEILLPLPLGTPTVATPADDTIASGARIRVVAGSWRGMRGEAMHVFARRQLTDLGLLVRAARVRLEDGTSPVVPLNFLERIG
jgi:hypothetical protein